MPDPDKSDIILPLLASQKHRWQWWSKQEYDDPTTAGERYTSPWKEGETSLKKGSLHT